MENNSQLFEIIIGSSNNNAVNVKCSDFKIKYYYLGENKSNY